MTPSPLTSCPPFTSLLIANRGEIACRIIASAQAMGLKAIAIYAEAEENSPHVRMADQAILIGPAPVTESYLSIEKIISAARKTGAQAIHPGYGFLSENADFARACESAGLVFIGPSPAAIELMGNKAAAKARLIAANIPCLPGYQGATQTLDVFTKEAARIGYPIMVKAAAGGGGRGMRLVTNPDQLPAALQDAASEAANAFGNDQLILELAILQPRHVEIQIMADQHGHVIHLGERDCSVQRRHQKILEEAPCPVMNPTLRAAMGATAIKIAQDIVYVGAGTVEFLLDENGQFFFLEMNTRLQVEHPVTEMITGLDLVALQLNIAQGQELPLTQAEVVFQGHAIEARVYAEDTHNDFLPATGHIDLWQPATGPDIRVDSGITAGCDVSPFYDPMLAKVIAHGKTREEARQRLIHALQQTVLLGLPTNKHFLIQALNHPDFSQGEATTGFILKNFDNQKSPLPPFTQEDAAIAAVLQFHAAQHRALQHSQHLPAPLLGWASAEPVATPFAYTQQEHTHALTLTPQPSTIEQPHYLVQNKDGSITAYLLSCTQYTALIELNNRRILVHYHHNGPQVRLTIEGRDICLTNQYALLAKATQTTDESVITAPMHGVLQEVFVKKGQNVKVGDRLAVLEAMKMQHEILARSEGTVTQIHAQQGAQIASGSLLIEISSTS